MVHLPRQLSAFSCITSRFEMAAKRGNMVDAFEEISIRLNTVATCVSAVAERRGMTETDVTPIAVSCGGEASAFGENTYAQGIMLGRVVDVGLVSYALGTCSFTAAASATGDTSAVAVTNSFADVQGADFVFIFTTSGSTDLDPGADLSFSTSTTSFLAIDLEFWDSSRGPIVIDHSRGICGLDLEAELGGNLAILESLLEAFGSDTVATVDAQVLTVEDRLSSVTAVGNLAVA